MGFQFHAKHVDDIILHPHKLGHLCGKTLLQPQHDEWIKYIWDGDEHRSLQAHRGSYKTTGITEVGAIRWMLFHPNDRIGFLRKPYSAAADSVAAVKNMMGLEEIRALFKFVHGIYPDFKMAKENRLTFSFKKDITREGNLNAYGIETRMTGTHLDKLIGDDFVILQDRISKAERIKTDHIIMEVITNIIDPGKQCSFVGTPWHPKDTWRLLPKPLKFPVTATGLLSDEEQEKIRKKTTSSLYMCNYHLEHTADEDKVFADPHYGPWDWKLYPIAHLDAKFDGNHTNALTFMAKRPDGKIHATGFVFHENIKAKADWVLEMYKKRRAKKIWNEENPDKGYTADLLKAKGMTTKTYHEKMNKHIKMVSFLKHYWDEIIWDEKIDPEYMEQILDYVQGEEPDDAPDSAASLLRQEFYGENTEMALWS